MDERKMQADLNVSFYQDAEISKLLRSNKKLDADNKDLKAENDENKAKLDVVVPELETLKRKFFIYLLTKIFNISQ